MDRTDSRTISRTISRKGRRRRTPRSDRIALAVLGLGLALGTAACDRSDAAPADDPAAVANHPAAHDGTATDADPGHADPAHGAHDGADHADHDAATHRDLDAGPASDFSIYHAASTWRDQTGAERELGSLSGRPQVVAMVYTSCAYACPRIMLDMKRIEGELGDRADDVGFVVVSIDPERDTPERLAEFAQGSRLDPDRWTLLTADEGDILELAALLGVQYRQTAPGEWVHSNLITVLDPEGVVTHRQLGLGTDPSETLSVLLSLID